MQSRQIIKRDNMINYCRIQEEANSKSSNKEFTG